jgi:glycosyltransferase involved in cell wall biosynthesis
VKRVAKRVSVTTPCYNEEANVRPMAEAIRAVFAARPEYDYEHIFIDNASTDRTVAILKEIAADDPHVKLIVNLRNFGVARSPLHAILQATGDAIVPIAADFQDPPELIAKFLDEWERGYKIVAAVKERTREGRVMALARAGFYRLLSSLSESRLIDDFTGFGLYDREVIELIRSTGDHLPYFRGLVADMGFDVAIVKYVRPERARGFSKNRLYDLYSEAWNGLTNHTKIPLRLAAFTGFVIAGLSLAVACVFFLYKLVFWQNFSVGVAPIVIGLFFLGSVQLIFLGVLGEYLGAIHTRMFQKWLVIERERVNFDRDGKRDGKRDVHGRAPSQDHDV